MQLLKQMLPSAALAAAVAAALGLCARVFECCFG